MKNIRKIIMVFTVIMLCMTVNIFAEDNELTDYLDGYWTFYDQQSRTVVGLDFRRFDGSFIYGNNDSHKGKTYYASGDHTYDEMYNCWWMSGKFEVIDNVIKMVVTQASGNKQSEKGKTGKWVVTIVDDNEMVITTSSWTRRFKKY